MKTLRKYLAMVFVVPGVMLMAVGLVIGSGLDNTLSLLEDFKKGIEKKINERN